ncbi:MAG: hypothetical protein ACLQA5_00290 [Solirubrobacteraceae bacterium]
MAHHVGAPDCDAELEMVVSFAGRPPERERELARGRPAGGERRDPASSPSHESA